LTGTTPHEALREAKRRLQTGEWYSDTEMLIRKTYQPVLMSYLKQFRKSKRMMKRVVHTWITCYTLNVTKDDLKTIYKAEMAEIQEYLRESAENHTVFVTSVLNTLCNNKHRLPVADLCAWVRGFG
jgi:exoribonuclease II